LNIHMRIRRPTKSESGSIREPAKTDRSILDRLRAKA
jgi:hypothetical protein